MVQTSYSNTKLFEMARKNYQKLVGFCDILDIEGYWEQPNSILNKSIHDMLDMYVQAVLINLSVYCNRFHEDERRFISNLPMNNAIACTIEGDMDEAVLMNANKIVSSPPILLQLCGVRDTEKQSDYVVQFFDSLLNILLALSYLNNAKDTYVTKFIQSYYERIHVFINNKETKERINPRYIFKKLSSDRIEEIDDYMERPTLRADIVKEQLQKVQYEVIKEQLQEQVEENPLDVLLQELNELIGLDEVKQEIYSLINLIKVKKMREIYQMPSMNMSYHMVFTGNPGTGKTTVARLVAKIYKELGILSEGNLVEIDRAGLVAGYVGQTALKVKEVVEKALGGVLFIDEAYSLTNNVGNNDFGSEVIDTLVKMMEDNRDNLVVIVAGYQKEMKEFLKANTGLISRFNKFIDFQDYSLEELIQILNAMGIKNGVQFDDDAIEEVKEIITNMPKAKAKVFGNARGIRNVFEKIIVNQANRLVQYDNPSVEQLQRIVKEDIYNII